MIKVSDTIQSAPTTFRLKKSNNNNNKYILYMFPETTNPVDKDELNHRILFLKIENFELQKLNELKKKEAELYNQLLLIKYSIKLQKQICKDVQTNYTPLDLNLQN
jgi:hypothetical protein